MFVTDVLPGEIFTYTSPELARFGKLIKLRGSHAVIMSNWETLYLPQAEVNVIGKVGLTNDYSE